MKQLLFFLALCFSSTGIVFASDEWPHPNISQAVFTTNVIDRTPVDTITTADSSIQKIFFYTNLRNLANRTIRHKWFHNGKHMAEITFNPKGNRWRVYSTKNIWHTWTGEWRVDVVDESNTVLYSKSLTYTK